MEWLCTQGSCSPPPTLLSQEKSAFRKEAGCVPGIPVGWAAWRLNTCYLLPKLMRTRLGGHVRSGFRSCHGRAELSEAWGFGNRGVSALKVQR